MKEFLQQHKVASVHKKIIKNFDRRQWFVPGIYHTISCDLIVTGCEYFDDIFALKLHPAKIIVNFLVKIMVTIIYYALLIVSRDMHGLLV